MKTLHEYPYGVSIVKIDRTYHMRIERGEQNWNWPCASLDEAHKRARIESWRFSLCEYYRGIHDRQCELVKVHCERCPFRSTDGCLNRKCPIHNLQTEINKAIRTTERTYNRLRIKI